MTDTQAEFDRILARACAAACALAAASRLSAEQQGALLATLEARLAARLSASPARTIRQSLSRAFAEALAYVLHAGQVHPGEQEGARTSAGFFGEGGAVSPQSAEQISGLLTGIATLAAVRTPPAAARGDAGGDGGAAAAAPLAVAERLIVRPLLSALSAPDPVPAHMGGAALTPHEGGQTIWPNAFALFLLWQVKTAAPLRHVLFSELNSADPRQRAAMEQFLDSLYAGAQELAQALNDRVASGLAERPAAAGADETNATAARGEAADRPEQGLMEHASRLAAACSLDAASLKTAALQLASLPPAHRPSIALLGAADATKTLEAALAHPEARLDDAARQRLAGRIAAGEWAALDGELATSQLAPGIEAARQLVLGRWRGLAAIAAGQQSAAAAHFAWHVEALVRSGRPADPEVLFALCATMARRARWSGQPQDIDNALAAIEQLMPATGAGPWPQRAGLIKGPLVAARGVPPGKAAERKAADEAIAAHILPALGETAAHGCEDLRLEAICDLVPALARLAAQEKASDKDRAKALLAQAVSAGTEALGSAPAGIDPALTVEIATATADALIQSALMEPKAAWAEQAVGIAAVAYEAGRSGGVADAPMRALLEQLAKAQAQLGRARKSRFWLERAVASYRLLISDSGDEASRYFTLGQLLSELAALSPDALEIQDAIQTFDAGLAKLPESQHWQRSVGVVGLLNALVTCGRKLDSPESLTRCIEEGERFLQAVPQGRLAIQRLQAHAAVAEALVLRATQCGLPPEGRAEYHFKLAFAIAEAEANVWWQRRLSALSSNLIRAD